MTSAQLNRPPRFALVVFGIAAAAVTLPISVGYFTAFLLLVWLVAARPWREPPAPAVVRRFDQIVLPVHIGVAALLTTHVIAAAASYAADQLTATPASTFAIAFKPTGHLLMKWGALWFVLAGAIRAAIGRGWQPLRLGAWLLPWMALLLAYCLAQRYTGVDWTHGWSARLGPNRFAYDVYRVSGFMGHPLTLGYNLVLLIATAGAFVVAPAGSAVADPPERSWRTRWTWPLIAVFAAAILVISGSRFPLAALGIALLPSLGSRLRHHWRWLVGGGLALSTAVALEGSMLRRVGELWDPSKPVAERFDRIIFWQVHLRLFEGHPFTGTGIWAIDAAAEQEYRAIGYTEHMYGAHNIFLQQMADSGLIGLAGLLALLGGIFLSARRATGRTGSRGALTALAWAAVVTGLLQNNFRDSEFVFAFWLLTALAAGVAATGAGVEPSARQ